MALDLNATPADGGDEGPDLNQPPADEQDRSIHDPLEAVGACEIERAGQNARPDDLPSLFDDAPVHNVCHPFDLNLPQQGTEQENLMTGEQDALEDLIEEFGVYSGTVDIAFDEEELSDSDSEEDEQTHDEEEDQQAHDGVHDDQENHDQAGHRTKELTDRQRQDIFEDLLRMSNNGKS